MLTEAQRTREAEEVSPAGRGRSVGKVCFRRGLEPSLWLLFLLCAEEPPGTGPAERSRCLCPQQKLEVRALLTQHLMMLRAFRVPG